MIMCVLLCYPVSIHMSQLQATGRPISSYNLKGILSIHLKLGKYIHSIKIWKSLDFGIDWLRNG